MAELNKSLTAMDWLPRLNAGGTLTGGLWLDQVTDTTEMVQADSSTPPSPPVNGKPPYSYANLITLAINSTNRRKMTLAEIYNWITDNFSYYRHAPVGWKNSVRHNLSLNKCFKKVPRTKDDPGKGSYWAIDSMFTGEEANKRKKQLCPRFNPYLAHTLTPSVRTTTLSITPANTSLNTITPITPSPLHDPHKTSTPTVNPWSHSARVDQWAQTTSLWNSQEGVLLDGITGTNVPVSLSVNIGGGGESECVARDSSVDGITMKDCDLLLLNNLTPEQLKEYAALLTPQNNNNANNNNNNSNNSNSNSGGSSGDGSSNFSSTWLPLSLPMSMPLSAPTCIPAPMTTMRAAPLTHEPTLLPLQTSGATLETLVADSLMISNAVPPDDVLRSPQQASTPGELPLDGSFSLSGHSDCGDSSGSLSLSAHSQTVSAASHGSGGTVTIMRREPILASPQPLSEPLGRLLAPLSPPLHAPPSDECLGGMLDHTLAQSMEAIQVGLITGSSPHSDDEEITDEFNWDKLL